MSDDVAAIHELIGRPPRGSFEVVVRDADGAPVVLRNSPLLDDGEPMPTRYWLVGRRQVLAVSRLEATGAVRRAEAEIDPAGVADAHRRYAAEHDAALPADHTGPRPHGGVGGTRIGVKCLHAHYAWFLAGGDDPVGAWVAVRLAEGRGPRGRAAMNTVTVHLDDMATAVELDGQRHVMPLGPVSLTSEAFSSDPPKPEELTNAIGAVVDHLDDMLRALPAAIDADEVGIVGQHAEVIAAVEFGGRPPLPFSLDRAAAEDVFRTVATESSRQRALNPGLPADAVETIVGACCIVVALMRRLHLDEVDLGRSA